MDLQDKFERNLEEAIVRVNNQRDRVASGHRLEVINDHKYSNVGTIFIQESGDFRSLVVLEYEFYNASVKITLSPPAAGWEKQEHGKSVFRAFIGDHGDPKQIEILSTVIDSVVAALT